MQAIIWARNPSPRMSRTVLMASADRPLRWRDVELRRAGLDERCSTVQLAAEGWDHAVGRLEHMAGLQARGVEVALPIGRLDPRDRARRDERLEARRVDLDPRRQ